MSSCCVWISTAVLARSFSKNCRSANRACCSKSRRWLISQMMAPSSPTSPKPPATSPTSWFVSSGRKRAMVATTTPSSRPSSRPRGSHSKPSRIGDGRSTASTAALIPQIVRSCFLPQRAQRKRENL
ncbi:MAG: hypothetical protein H6656_02525 [Ardenticatenaceae bacterium]|nr:hypothetical protein [Ardenticatenaceae bacterium]